MSRVKSYLTTGEAAALFDVDPDTVLRWIKSGDIPAIRTPGGHYRIHKNVFINKLITNEDNAKSNLPHCWEFHSESGLLKDECKECIAYKSRTSRCYELSKLSELTNHTKLLCTYSCEECSYFRDSFQISI